MINWPIITTWENWLIIPVICLFVVFLMIVSADLIEEKN